VIGRTIETGRSEITGTFEFNTVGQTNAVVPELKYQYASAERRIGRTARLDASIILGPQPVAVRERESERE
jgi:hypothetical protein